MYLLTIFIALINFLILGLTSKYYGKKGSGIIALFFSLLNIISCIFTFYEVIWNNVYCSIKLTSWIESGLLAVEWGFLYDTLSVIMLIVVSSITYLVILYSLSYMEQDPHLPRFLSYLSLFSFFMLILVTADNYFNVFLGWEGVGLCSYLLINFWFTRLQANLAAIKAIIVNRFGDFALALSFMTIFYIYKSLDFTTIFALVPLYSNKFIILMNYEIYALNLICFLIFIGAVGKSAQIGLHTWLPDAMEGPTPVSALIHAATMVTAGVIVIIRNSILFEYSPSILTLLTIFGAITAFFAATVGLVQNDLKKVIAYSTCSQLGYMIFACGLSNYNIAMFHLTNHAFFKALLFLSAGAIIHAMNDEQDMRKMGSLFMFLPFTYTMVIIGSLSLMGFPFLTGFYSKDIILEASLANIEIKNIFSYWLGTMAAFLTAFYSFRLIYLTFLTKYNGYRKIIYNIHEAPLKMSISLFILAVASVFIGYILKDMFIGMGSPIWNNVLYNQLHHNNILESEFLRYYIKLIPVIISILGSILAIILYNYYWSKVNIYILKSYVFYYVFLIKKWCFDYLYNELIGKYFLDFSYKITFKYLDRGLIEFLGPQGIIILGKRLLLIFTNIQSGYIYNYVFVMMIGLILLFFLNFNLEISNKYFITLLFISGVFIFLDKKNKNIQKNNIKNKNREESLTPHI